MLHERRVHAVRRLAHEAGPGARHAPEGGHPAAGRAHQPPGRDQRGVGEGLPERAQGRHLHHGVARQRPAQRRVLQHHRHQEPQAAPDPGQPQRVREEQPRRQVLLRAQGLQVQVQVPAAGEDQGGQHQGQVPHEDGRLLLHVPRQHRTHHHQHHSARLPGLARGLRRPQRGRQVHHDQDPHRGAGAPGGRRVEAPLLPCGLRGPARLPPH
mmetsp:Transcript_33265/g.93266  ORF Transcript_33265/g.93266 Transcript_33265/m.93266 type:complete len:211 (-) Transcript_33265:1056-1688(-)